MASWLLAATAVAAPAAAAAGDLCLSARMPAGTGDRQVRLLTLHLRDAEADEGGGVVFVGEARLRLASGGPQEDVGRVACRRAAVGFSCRYDLDGAVGRFWLEPEEVNYRLVWDHLPARRGETLDRGFPADRVVTLDREDRTPCP